MVRSLRPGTVPELERRASGAAPSRLRPPEVAERQRGPSAPAGTGLDDVPRPVPDEGMGLDEWEQLRQNQHPAVTARQAARPVVDHLGADERVGVVPAAREALPGPAEYLRH